MEHNHKNDKEELASVKYVFATNQSSAMGEAPPTGISTKKWQILFCTCASLTCIPFGLSLGWPSPTYPTLFLQSAPIQILGDQSAMIAGFLMLGNTIGTPFSIMTLFGSKGGLIIGNALMFVGWLLMWHAKGILWLLGSRFCVGFGHGLAMGQLKSYIAEQCDESLKIILTKCINLYTYLGVIAMFSYGSLFSFEYTSFLSATVCLVVLFFIIFLPSRPKHKNIRNTKIFWFFKSSYKNDEDKIQDSNKKWIICQLFKNKELRNNFFVFTILVFCQQFTGLPATLVYSQFIFNNFQSPNLLSNTTNCSSPFILEECQVAYTKYFALVYVILYFCINIIGIFYSPRYNKKLVLLISSFSVSVTIILEICILYFRLDYKIGTYTSTIVIYIYMIVHTLGLGNIPVTFIPDWFPVSYRNFVTLFFIMFHSMLALVITKLFQMITFRFTVLQPFYLFFSISLLCILHILLFVKKIDKTEQVKVDSIQIQMINKNDL